MVADDFVRGGGRLGGSGLGPVAKRLQRALVRISCLPELRDVGNLQRSRKMAIDGAEHAAAASSEVFETSELCHEGAIEGRFNARDDAENDSIARFS